MDLPKQTEVFEGVSNPNELLFKLNATLEELRGTWPLWEVIRDFWKFRTRNFNNNFGNFQYKSDHLSSDVLDIVTFLLPGVNLVDKNASLSQELLNLRNSPSIMFGDLTKYIIANNSAFAYIR